MLSPCLALTVFLLTSQFLLTDQRTYSGRLDPLARDDR